MFSLEFTEFSSGINGVILVVAGCVVWLAGTNLARLADEISARTGLSKVLAGALLLGAATSLPEIATTVTASALGNASLAVNNLFGGVAMQLAVLAVIDFWFVRRGPLTFFSPDPVLLLGGVLLVMELALSIVAMATGDVEVFGRVGAWPLLLAAGYLLSLYFMNRFAARDTWTPSHSPDQTETRSNSSDSDRSRHSSRSTTLLGALFAANCLLIVASGWAVSTSADALAAQTGIGSGFIGATLVALTTSLPEVSTTAGAVRLGAFTMAISNIFGTNTLEIALLLPADLAYRDGSVFNAIGDSELLMAALGIVMTSLYLWGLLERRDKSVLRMGIDSWWAILAYVAGLGLLYGISS